MNVTAVLTTAAVFHTAATAAQVADFYAMAFCLCGVILATEPDPRVGLLWAAACCLGGAPFGCVWCAARLLRHGPLRLQGGTLAEPQRPSRSSINGLPEDAPRPAGGVDMAAGTAVCASAAE